MGRKKEKLENKKYDLDTFRHIDLTCRSFNIPVNNIMSYVNSGTLGYQNNDDGTPRLDKNGNPVPISIPRATFYRYIEEIEKEGSNQIYSELSKFAMSGYAKMLRDVQEEIKHLHTLSAENLFQVPPGAERQSIIDSIATKIIPLQTGFADMLQDMFEQRRDKTELPDITA